MANSAPPSGFPPIGGMVRVSYDVAAEAMRGTVTLTVPYGSRTVSKTYEVEVPEHLQKLCVAFFNEVRKAETMDIYTAMLEATQAAVRLGETP